MSRPQHDTWSQFFLNSTEYSLSESWSEGLQWENEWTGNRFTHTALLRTQHTTWAAATQAHRASCIQYLYAQYHKIQEQKKLLTRKRAAMPLTITDIMTTASTVWPILLGRGLPFGLMTDHFQLRIMHSFPVWTWESMRCGKFRNICYCSLHNGRTAMCGATRCHSFCRSSAKQKEGTAWHFTANARHSDDA